MIKKSGKKPEYENDEVRVWNDEESEPEGEEIIINGEKVGLVGFVRLQKGDDVPYLKFKPDVVLYVAQTDGAREFVKILRSFYPIPFKNTEDAFSHLQDVEKKIGDKPVDKSKWK